MNRGLLILLVLYASFISTSIYSAEIPEKIVLAGPQNLLPATIGKNILTTAYQRIGVKVEFVDLPSKRSIVRANRGVLDGEVSRVRKISESYSNLIRVPTAINYIDRVLYSTRKIVITSCEDLANYSVGIRRGVKHAEKCSSYARKVSVFNNLSQMMKVLNKGRIDFVIESRLNGLPFESNKDFPKIMLITPSLGRSNLYHYLHKSNVMLVDKIDKILISMAKSGELEAIREQTILDNLQSLNYRDFK